MLRWYWYFCGAVYVRETALLRHHQPEDYEERERRRNDRRSISRSDDTIIAGAQPATSGVSREAVTTTSGSSREAVITISGMSVAGAAACVALETVPASRTQSAGAQADSSAVRAAAYRTCA